MSVLPVLTAPYRDVTSKPYPRGLSSLLPPKIPWAEIAPRWSGMPHPAVPLVFRDVLVTLCSVTGCLGDWDG